MKRATAAGPGRRERGGDVAQVTVLPGAVRIESRDGETVPGAAMRSGFRYRFGCRRGGCGVCKVLLILGEVRDSRPIASSVPAQRRVTRVQLGQALKGRKEERQMGVMQLGFVHLRVTDLEEAREHYFDTLGMTVVAEQPASCTISRSTWATGTTSSRPATSSRWTTSRITRELNDRFTTVFT